MPKYINVDKLKFPNVAVYDMMLDGRAVPVVRLDELHKLPSENVVEVKHGQWFLDSDDELDTLLDGVSADNEALCETIEMLKKQVFDMSSLIGDYSEKTHWVSVTERLPEDGEDVLCWISDKRRSGQGYEMVGCYNSTLKLWNMDADWVSTLDITHWRTLPEPPKEEV